MIHRRMLLTRDPATNFAAAISELRTLTGWGYSELSFTLNIPRSTLQSIESRGSQPQHDDGQAILKLLTICRNCGTAEQVQRV